MISRRVATAGAAVLSLLALTGCADGRDGPTSPASLRSGAASLSARAAGQVAVSGNFDALVDFSTVTLTPKGGNCLLQVHGRLVFHGTVEGVANGVTSALEFAPCDQVAFHPPGTFPDVFKSDAVFDGTVAGQPAHSNLTYMGRVAIGGAIDGRFIFSNGVDGAVDADAVVAVGGTYEGSVVVH